MLTQWSASTKKISLKLHSPCRPTFFSWDQYPKLEMDFQLQFGCWSSYQDAGWVCNWHSFIKMVGCSLPGSRWSQKKLILMAACILPNYLLTSNLSQPTLRTKCLGKEQMLKEFLHVGTLTLSDCNSFHIARRWVCLVASVFFLCVCHDCLVRHQVLSIWPNTC